MKNRTIDKKENNVVFKVLLIGMTVIFAIAALLIVIKPFQIRSIDRIKEITLAEYNTMLDASDDHDHEESHEYLIFVYDSRTTDPFNKSQNEEVERYIIEYANYARKHKDASKIYVLDISKSENKDALATLSLKEDNMPSVVVMKNNHSSITIQSRYKTIQDIQTYLLDLMK